MDKLLHLADFIGNNVIGQYADKILKYFGLNLPGYLLVPALLVFGALLAVFVAVPVIWYVLKMIFGLLTLLMMGTVKGSGQSGRFATFMEIFKAFSIPSRFSYFLFNYIAMPLTILIIIFASILSWHFFVNNSSGIPVALKNKPFLAFVLIGSCISGVLFRRIKNYKDTKKVIQPFPLGRYKFLNVYLTGGKRKSFIRGNVKEQRQEHVLMIGPTGSGKTSCYFIPPLIEDAFGYASSIFVEVKASSQENVFDVVAPVWNAQGKKVLLFDPWSNGPTLHFNPLLGLKPDFNDDETVRTSKLLVNALYETAWAEQRRRPGEDIHFVRQEWDLLRPLMILTQFKPVGMRNFTAIREVVGGTVADVCAFINSTVSFSSREIASDIRREFSWFTEEKNMRVDRKAEILTSIKAILDVYASPNVRACTMDNNIDLDIVMKEPSLLCLKAPLNERGASTIPSMIVRMLMLKAYDKSKYGAGEDFKLWFYLDELASLALSDLPKFVQTARSAGVGVVAGVQAKGDLLAVTDPRMGNLGIDAILPNFKTKILFPGLDFDTARYFSQSFGKKEVTVQSGQRHVTEPISFRYNKQKKDAPLVTEDALQYMDNKFQTAKNLALIYNTDIRPFFVKTRPWYKTRKYKKIVEQTAGKKPIIYAPVLKNISFESPTVPAYSTYSKDSSSKAGADIKDYIHGGGVASQPMFAPEDANLERISSDILQSGSSTCLKKTKDKDGKPSLADELS